MLYSLGIRGDTFSVSSPPVGGRAFSDMTEKGAVKVGQVRIADFIANIDDGLVTLR
jgi:hypothetical protein